MEFGSGWTALRCIDPIYIYIYIHIYIYLYCDIFTYFIWLNFLTCLKRKVITYPLNVEITEMRVRCSTGVSPNADQCSCQNACYNNQMHFGVLKYSNIRITFQGKFECFLSLQ